MQSDDLLPNDGAFLGGVPREPLEQAVERKHERAQTLESLKVLQSIIHHFNKRIEFYSSVDAIDNELKADPAAFMNMHNANEIVRDNLRAEKEYIESLLDANAKNR